MTLWAFDPALRCTGWACFEGSELIRCGAVVVQNLGPADTVVYVSQRLFGTDNLMDVAVVELPQVYQGRRSKGDPNDLISVAAVAGALASRARQAWFVRPHTWKGTLPKAGQLSKYLVHTRNEEALSDSSLEAYKRGLEAWNYSLRHNIADAVGIGLWALKNGLGTIDTKCYNQAEEQR